MFPVRMFPIPPEFFIQRSILIERHVPVILIILVDIELREQVSQRLNVYV